MIPDTDIHKIAIRMIRKHGAAAPTYADIQADNLLGVDDTHNYETWKRILLAIEELLTTRPLEAASVHQAPGRTAFRPGESNFKVS